MNLPWHVEAIERLLEQLGADAEHGLTAEGVARARAKYGPNRLPESPRKSALRRIFEQFTNPLVLTLLAAAAITVGVGLTSRSSEGPLQRYGDAIAILLIVILNAALGFFQERKAEAALDALRKMAVPVARIWREGRLVEISSEEVVPGDVLQLEAGDAIAADARLIEAIDLSVEEAALTGESAARAKDARATNAPDAPLADRTNMVFTGTTAVRGRGRAVAVATGANTELGRIGGMIATATSEQTPLEKLLETFGKRVLIACLAIAALLFVWGLLRPVLFPSMHADPWHLLLLEAVSLAVAAIPEGLPAITTITLALGTQRMAKLGAIVRKLPAVETLGAATVICSDKTGTLTQNRMVVREVWAGGTGYVVTGDGYDPRGEIRTAAGESVTAPPVALGALLETAVLCNDASLESEASGQWKVIGDPTEGALLALAARGGKDPKSLKSSVQIVKEIPFESARKRMTVVTRDEGGRVVAHVKGSLDVLLPRSTRLADAADPRALTEDDRARIVAEAERMSAKALRVLAFCERADPDGDPEESLTFLGLVGMMDPPRTGVPEAVAECRAAGIRVVMITGDNKLTAAAVAKEIGLWVSGDEAMTGTELDALGDADLAKRIEAVRVFARTSPEQKLRIVRALKALGHIVAMTGDGVNDAPALKEAHIGIAMGQGGTEVARQAADLVLADDNFATIVAAVREGRAIYRNIQKFIVFLLSSNAGLCGAVFLTSLIGDWPPLTPLMILWINLVTNGLPALALGVDLPGRDQMRDPPQRVGAALLSGRDYALIAYVGVVMTLISATFHIHPREPADLMLRARALMFSYLALGALVHAYNCVSSRSLVRVRGLLKRPLTVAIVLSVAIHFVAVGVAPLRPVFRTYALDLGEALKLVVACLAIVPLVELWKLFVGRLGRSGLSDGERAATSRVAGARGSS